jgi:D-alanyl-D-alanine carboxypeptidase (penicillin-binding protein 5/6)
LAEAVSGSESSFATLMNDKAREFKMIHSHFVNATGLPDPNHYSTARDLAVLAQHLINEHGQYYHYYSETEFTYNNIKQGNRNPLLYRNMGVDGVKTGHTEDAGYGLIASAVRENRRVITVVNGLSSMQERADEPAKLIEWAYREYGFFSLLNTTDKVAEAKIWLGNVPSVGLAAGKELNEVLPRAVKDKIQVVYEVNPETEAPILKGQQLGKATISIPDVPPIEVPLVAMEDVKRLSVPKALWYKFLRLLKKA